MESLRELYKVGMGPSSSHTIGPQKAAEIIKSKYEVQIITDKNVQDMIDKIRDNNMAVSILKLEGKNKNKYMLYVEVGNNKLKDLSRIVKSIDNRAFMVVNETMFVHNGYFGLNK